MDKEIIKKLSALGFIKRICGRYYVDYRFLDLLDKCTHGGRINEQ